MSDSDAEGTHEEREQLLSPTEPDSASPANPDAPPPDAPAPPPVSTWEQPAPETHFQSLSVNLRLADSPTFIRGSARIVETDRGAEHDFCSIDVDILWSPRLGASAPEGGGPPELGKTVSIATFESQPKTPSADEAPPPKQARVSVDEVLTIRVADDPGEPPSLAVHVRGGAHWGILEFTNGRDVLHAFLAALDRHVVRLPLSDEFLPGDLFAVEAAARMRRAARSLSDIVPGDSGEAIRAAANAGSPGDASEAAPLVVDGISPRIPDRRPGLSILEGFAQVTQLTRDLGENLALVFNDQRRQAMLDRRLREERARQRALDIHAEIVASSADEGHLPPRMTLDRPRGQPVSRAVWDAAHDADGRLRDPAAMRHAVFAGGMEPSVRREVWPVLLGLYPWNTSLIGREAILDRKTTVFCEKYSAWTAARDAARKADAESLEKEGAKDLTREQRLEESQAQLLQSAEQIEKDISRTDRTVELYAEDNAEASRMMGELLNIYSEHDAKIRYCQGMSDFLSPILYNIGVEHPALVFWCFEGLMQRCECNFRMDQSGIHKQLGRLKRIVEIAEPALARFFEKTDAEYYTCFRWILVRLKRELAFGATARLWEVLWCRQVAGDDLHLYVAVGLLAAHKQRLLALPVGEFDSLLRYINDMSGRIDVDFAIREGELLFRKLGRVK